MKGHTCATCTGLCVCVWGGGGGQRTTYRSQFSFHHVDPWDLTQGLRLNSKCAYLLVPVLNSSWSLGETFCCLMFCILLLLVLLNYLWEPIFSRTELLNSSISQVPGTFTPRAAHFLQASLGRTRSVEFPHKHTRLRDPFSKDPLTYGLWSFLCSELPSLGFDYLPWSKPGFFPFGSHRKLSVLLAPNWQWVTFVFFGLA